MNRQWTIGQKLTAGFGVLITLLLAAFAVAALTARSARSGQREASVVAARVRLAAQVQALNANMFAAERAMIVAGASGDSDRMTWWHEHVDASIKQAHQKLDELKGLMVSSHDQAQVAKLAEGMKAWETGCLACHDETSQMGDPATMQRLSEKTQAMMEANAKLADEIEREQHSQFEAQSAQLETESARSLWTLGVVLLVGLVVGGAVLRSVRQISHWLAQAAAGLHENVAHVFDAASQMSAAAQSLSQGASEQAASLEETSAAMNEMSSMTSSNTEHSAAAAALSAEAEQRVRSANETLTAMVASMASIEQSSVKVSKILRVVDEIAFQTNILALNAAVEAARAGEAGMGFAVVADEVRNLAQRSAQAARDTAALIDESMAATGQGQAKVSEMSNAIAAVTDAITKVQALAAQVHQASAEQKQGFDQVTAALLQIEKTTQTTAASAEESAATSETLNAQAEQTLHSVDMLAAMVGASAAGAPPKPRAQVLRWGRSSADDEGGERMAS
ncbi:MAG: methyl-accepting chemotaxis protein [Vicinamibacterales bacterium]|nr:methyl-accepting chemotaxis protein [Vicinamibacterales bacterium]